MSDLGDVTVLAPPPGASRVRTLKLAGEFDLSNNHELEQALATAIDAGGRDLIVDLGEVSFLDGTALNALVLAGKRCARRNGHLVLVRPGPQTWRVFAVTGMSRAFATFDSRSAAERYLLR